LVDADRPHVTDADDPRIEGASAAQHDASSKPDLDRLTQRSIRSFVVRNGRQTSAQAEALETLMPRYGIAFQNRMLDLQAVFERDAPCWLEIGFGNGDSLLHTASINPQINFLGVEVHAPGIGHALNGIKDRALSNVRLIHHDAMEVLQQMLAPGSLSRVLLLYPDPWHKKRHHKRRIVQKEFLDAVAKALHEQGILHCATDWEEYAHWMMEHLEAHDDFANTCPDFATRPDYRVVSRFERRGARLGHQVFDLMHVRN